MAVLRNAIKPSAFEQSLRHEFRFVQPSVDQYRAYVMGGGAAKALGYADTFADAFRVQLAMFKGKPSAAYADKVDAKDRAEFERQGYVFGETISKFSGEISFCTKASSLQLADLWLLNPRESAMQLMLLAAFTPWPEVREYASEGIYEAFQSLSKSSESRAITLKAGIAPKLGNQSMTDLVYLHRMLDYCRYHARDRVAFAAQTSPTEMTYPSGSKVFIMLCADRARDLLHHAQALATENDRIAASFNLDPVAAYNNAPYFPAMFDTGWAAMRALGEQMAERIEAASLLTTASALHVLPDLLPESSEPALMVIATFSPFAIMREDALTRLKERLDAKSGEFLKQDALFAKTGLREHDSLRRLALIELIHATNRLDYFMEASLHEEVRREGTRLWQANEPALAELVRRFNGGAALAPRQNSGTGGGPLQVTII